MKRRAFLLAMFLLGVLSLRLTGAPHSRNNDVTRGCGFHDPHPEPRPGISARNVVRSSDLRDYPGAVPVFDMVRSIPQIADGIRCHCGCAELPTMYSLLSCFEGYGMAKRCQDCQAQAGVAYRAFMEGRSLADIRVEVDRRAW